MRPLFLMIFCTLLFACQKESKKQPRKSKEEVIIDFCKTNIALNFETNDSITFDPLLTKAFKVPRNYKYYQKELDESYGFKQIEDSISEKWQVSVHYDVKNKSGNHIKNNIMYIIKDNTQYYHDTIFNERFIILSKRDENKLHENLGIE